MIQIVKHPILSNPLRYSRSRRSHASVNYIHGVYDWDALNSDPVAAGLVDTKMDGVRVRLPRGNLIRLIVEKSQSGLQLVPALKKTKENSHLPCHYIINNSTFVNFILDTKQWRRYIPQKFKFYNTGSLVDKVELTSSLDNTIRESYSKYIREEMANYKKSAGSAGLLLVNEGPLIKFNASEPVVNFTRIIDSIDVEYPLRIDYDKNPALCRYILQFVDYISE